jgi:hypothetical protein
VSTLAYNYSRAASDRERLAVCLEAIEAGVIAEGQPVSAVDEIFGTELAQYVPFEDQPGVGYAELPLTCPPRDYVTAEDVANQPTPIGWRLIVEYDSFGTLLNYVLTRELRFYRPCEQPRGFRPPQ